MLGTVRGIWDIVVNKIDQFLALIEFIIQAFIIFPASHLNYCESHSYFFWL